MKKLFTILLLCAVAFFTNTAYASVSTAPAAGLSGLEESTKLGIDDLKTMEIKDIEAKIGHDLTWKQKLAIKMLKSKMAKAERHPEKPAGTGSTFIGLLLGLFLFLLGVLIAYLAFNRDRDVIKGAWIGAAVVLVLYLLVL